MATRETRGRLETPGGGVSSVAITPSGAMATLVVAHGAGAGMDHPFLVGFCQAIAAQGVATLRFTFPYLERGRRSTDPERVLRETWLAAFGAATEGADVRPVLAGGKSLGGRIASMCVADGMPAAGLVFLGYPLHPPGKPERVRDRHLDRVRVPMLFLQGTRDPFARPDVLRPVLERLGDRVTYEAIEGGDHSFRVPGGTRDDGAIGAGLASKAAGFVRGVAGDR